MTSRQTQRATLIAALTAGILAFGLATRAPAIDRERPPCVSAADCPPAPGAEVFCRDSDSDGQKECHEGFEAPPSVPLTQALSLGRYPAAADLAWINVVQFVGDDYSELVDYAGIERWIALINELSPDYLLPYFYGAILLSTSPNRANEADRILARAAEALGPTHPKVWQVHQWRAFVNYFGMLDPEGAIPYYELAYKAGGPEYLRQRVKTLRAQVHNCGTVAEELRKTILESQNSSGGALLDANKATKLVLGCERKAIDEAAATYHLRTDQYAPTVQTLVDAKLLERPPWAPLGQCWVFGEVRDRSELVPCAGLRVNTP